MATQAQIEANRRNARKSTGPRTQEGKARAARNGIRHGLFADRTILKTESEEEFNESLDALVEEWRPVGHTEEILVRRIHMANWRLLRAWRMEANLLSRNGVDFEINNLRDREDFRMSDGGRTLDRFARYSRSIEREIDQAINQLRTLQTDRRERDADCESNPIPESESLSRRDSSVESRPTGDPSAPRPHVAPADEHSYAMPLRHGGAMP